MVDPTDPLRNARDPLHGSGPQVGLELFRAMGKLASGMPADAVINAAAALLINAIRQTAPNWQRAEQLFDELFGRSKQLLSNHYDQVSGRKKGIFPYDQHIVLDELFVERDRHNGS